MVTLIALPKVDTSKLDPFDRDEIPRLLEAITGDQLACLLVVTPITGLRQDNALGLRWEDVALDKVTRCVRLAMQRVDGKLRFVEPQSARGKHDLARPTPVVAAIRAPKVRQSEERLPAGELAGPGTDLHDDNRAAARAQRRPSTLPRSPNLRAVTA